MTEIISRSAFEVSFVHQHADEQVRLLKPLVQHVIAVDLGTELLEAVPTHRTNTLIIWIADDSASASMKAIRDYVAAGNDPFRVMVKVLRADGQSGLLPKDIFIYQSCSLHALQHSIFTRENHDERIQLFNYNGVNVLNTGVIKQPIAREQSAKLLQVAFAGFEHHILDNIQ